VRTVDDEGKDGRAPTLPTALRTLLGWAGGVGVFALMILHVLVQPHWRDQGAWELRAKALARLLCACFGMRVTLTGGAGLPEGPTPKGLVLVCNHVNFLDGFLLYGHLPLSFRVLDQAQHFSWPVWGWFSRRLGNISLDQSGGGRTAAALRAADRRLAGGAAILVFPEGHRTRDGSFLDFHRGAFRLAERSGALLQPLVIAGLWEVHRKGGGGIKPGPVELRVLEAWPPEAREGRGAAELRDLVRGAMESDYREARTRLIRSSRGTPGLPEAASSS